MTAGKHPLGCEVSIHVRCGDCPYHSDEYYSFDCDGDGDSGFTHYCNEGGTRKCLGSNDRINPDTCKRALEAVSLAASKFCASHSNAPTNQQVIKELERLSEISTLENESEAYDHAIALLRGKER